MSFGPVGSASQHSGPYDATTVAEQPDCSAPGRAAFFSLVFFAGQRKVTGSPRRGMSYGPWVQKPTPLKETATNPSRAMSYSCWVQDAIAAQENSNQPRRATYFNLNGSNNAASYSPLPILPNSSIRSKI